MSPTEALQLILGQGALLTVTYPDGSTLEPAILAWIKLETDQAVFAWIGLDEREHYIELPEGEGSIDVDTDDIPQVALNAGSTVSPSALIEPTWRETDREMLRRWLAMPEVARLEVPEGAIRASL